MATLLVTSCLLSLVGSVAESKYGPKNGAGKGATEFILIGTSFWVFIYGFNVGTARSKAIKDAKADGEDNVDERYGLPNLYAQGTSKHARIFNCAQRSHQHILETFTQLCVAGLTAAVNYPITSAFTTAVYAIGRYQLSKNYANEEGDASKRYSSKLAIWNWYGLASTITLGLISSVKAMLGDKMY